MRSRSRLAALAALSRVATSAERRSASATAWAPAAPSTGTHGGRHGPPGEEVPRGGHHGPLGAADGLVPEGVTVFDDSFPAVTRLDPGLLTAVRRAATDAGDDIAFYVHSGWRSPAYQIRLLRDAVAKYGSAQEAARWVATPATSAHVKGKAIDVGRSDATAWLSSHGAGYGLCQIYGNEPWHYELRPGAIGHGCPRMYADPTDDPRMRR